jgi:hypothetical protein
MNTHADKTQENKSQSVSTADSQFEDGGESSFQFVDNRPEAVAQIKLQEVANNSPQVSQFMAFQDMANNSPQAKQATQLKSMADNNTVQNQLIIQKKENNTGLPDNLKSGMENLSGVSLDDVKVHRNSEKPAQLQAHAYAQGTDIHLGAGQEKHLPHEAWHVVQQKQGRVKPTLQMKGKVNVNDDVGLEKEADVMGAKALMQGKQSFGVKQMVSISPIKQVAPIPVLQGAFIGRIQMRPWLQKLLGKPIDKDGLKELETKNLDHSHIYFEDGDNPAAIGYGKNGIMRGEEGNPRGEATPVRSGLDDGIVRSITSDKGFMAEWDKKIVIGESALGEVLEKHPNYKLLTHNCQHFAKAVDSEYAKRLKDRPRRGAVTEK